MKNYSLVTESPLGDAKKTLDKYSLGIAHHKVIHIISVHEGITISNLLKKLKVTKQSLNRILNDLVKFNIISFVKDEKDSRMKHVHLTKKGEEVFNEIFNSQKKRIYNALINSSSFLNKIAFWSKISPSIRSITTFLEDEFKNLGYLIE